MFWRKKLKLKRLSDEELQEMQKKEDEYNSRLNERDEKRHKEEVEARRKIVLAKLVNEWVKRICVGRGAMNEDEIEMIKRTAENFAEKEVEKELDLDLKVNPIYVMLRSKRYIKTDGTWTTDYFESWEHFRTKWN
jgi:hypothetical protein